MRTTVCLVCGDRTGNGSRCERCSGGRRAAPGARPYDDPRYRRLRRQALDQHRRTFGPRCPRCLRPEDRAVRSTWLTANHVTMLAKGGAILGELEVLCLRCNVQQEHAELPELAMARSARRGLR